MNSVALRCGLALVLLLPLAARGEDIGPGKYRGTYHVDRWRQHRFDFLFVHPKLGERLQKYAGRPVELDVSNMVQPMNPGSAMILDFKEVRETPPRVAVELDWIEPEAKAPYLRGAPEGKPIVLRLKIKNLSTEPFDLNKCDVKLLMSIHVPSAPAHEEHPKKDPLGFFGGRESLDMFWFGGLSDEDRKSMVPGNVCFRQDELKLDGGDATIDFAEGWDKRSSLQSPRQAPVLGASESDFWLIKIENLPPNEYELAAAAVEHSGDQKPIKVVSRSLALDIGLTKPIEWNGVTASLATKERFARVAAVDTPATLTLTNDSSSNFGDWYM